MLHVVTQSVPTRRASDRGDQLVPEVRIPLVGMPKELELLKEVVDRVAKEVQTASGVQLDYLVGTMIELPRAALLAREIARTAEFFSFGTNDLTQTTFGISRDDSASFLDAYQRRGISRDDSASFLDAYQRRGILEKDPFVSLDVEGVGELVRIAAERDR